MSWWATDIQLVLDGVLSASFCITSPQVSKQHASETIASDSVGAISYNELRVGNQKISGNFTFCKYTRVPATYKADKQSLYICALHYLQAQVLPDISSCC